VRAFALAIALAAGAHAALPIGRVARLSMGYSARTLPKSALTPRHVAAGGPPLAIDPVQMDGADALLTLTNRRQRPIHGRLTGGRAALAVTLKAGQAQTVRLIAAGWKAHPGVSTVAAPVTFRGRVGDTPWNGTKTLEFLRPVIPMSEREAPTVEMLFAASPTFELNRPDQVSGRRAWTPRNLSARVQLLHDETGLAIHFDVRDDIQRQTRAGRDIRQEDSVEVGIQAGAGNSARVLVFGYALTPHGPVAVRYRGAGAPGMVDARRVGDHTVYDVRIGWPDLAPLTGAVGERFRMDFAAIDSDGPGPPARIALTPDMDTPSCWLTWTLE
jgi:hypothetical protein